MSGVVRQKVFEDSIWSLFGYLAPVKTTKMHVKIQSWEEKTSKTVYAVFLIYTGHIPSIFIQLRKDKLPVISSTLYGIFLGR